MLNLIYSAVVIGGGVFVAVREKKLIAIGPTVIFAILWFLPLLGLLNYAIWRLFDFLGLSGFYLRLFLEVIDSLIYFVLAIAPVVLVFLLKKKSMRTDNINGACSVQSVSQPAAQPVSQPAAQPVSQPAAQPVSQPAAQPVSQPAAQPVSQPAAQPVSLPTPQPVFQVNIQTQNEGMKRCPFCQELIKEGAIKCRFCHEFLVKTDGPAAQPVYQPAAVPPAPSAPAPAAVPPAPSAPAPAAVPPAPSAPVPAAVPPAPSAPVPAAVPPAPSAPAPGCNPGVRAPESALVEKLKSNRQFVVKSKGGVDLAVESHGVQIAFIRYRQEGDNGIFDLLSNESDQTAAFRFVRDDATMTGQLPGTGQALFVWKNMKSLGGEIVSGSKWQCGDILLNSDKFREFLQWIPNISWFVSSKYTVSEKGAPLAVIIGSCTSFKNAKTVELNRADKVLEVLAAAIILNDDAIG